jgi:hypothetical protein
MDNTTKKMAENLNEKGAQSEFEVELGSELAMNSFDNQMVQPRHNTDIVHKINSILRSGSGLHRHS